MGKFEDRAVRIREIFEEERDDVLTCMIIQHKDEMTEDCHFCNSSRFCEKAFKEETEGGG